MQWSYLVSISLSIHNSLLLTLLDIIKHIVCVMHSAYQGFLTRMVYLYYISCLRYTILIRNPWYNSQIEMKQGGKDFSYASIKGVISHTCNLGLLHHTQKHVSVRETKANISWNNFLINLFSQYHSLFFCSDEKFVLPPNSSLSAHLVITVTLKMLSWITSVTRVCKCAN